MELNTVKIVVDSSADLRRQPVRQPRSVHSNYLFLIISFDYLFVSSHFLHLSAQLVEQIIITNHT